MPQDFLHLLYFDPEKELGHTEGRELLRRAGRGHAASADEVIARSPWRTSASRSSRSVTRPSTTAAASFESASASVFRVTLSSTTSMMSLTTRPTLREPYEHTTTLSVPGTIAGGRPRNAGTSTS